MGRYIDIMDVGCSVAEMVGQVGVFVFGICRYKMALVWERLIVMIEIIFAYDHMALLCSSPHVGWPT